MRPFEELELPDEHRFQPAAVLHLGGRQFRFQRAWAAARAIARRRCGGEDRCPCRTAFQAPQSAERGGIREGVARRLLTGTYVFHPGKEC